MAIAIAFAPVGVVPDGVNPEGVPPPDGVRPPGVSPPWAGVRLGVIAPGVMLGVIPPPAGVAPGVSSQRDRRLLAPGVGVSCIRSPPPPRSVWGVSAQPLPCPGVSVARKQTSVKNRQKV